ncbi:DUF1513 domain-containing protein [Anderseniella sp. Alg231-50]|uniref:DUF1513 domain-containing protein n=1 Tax=Anderseniella sp. Alg231-50 TaxID=1922226 RepID=UPI000D54BF06
MDDVDPGCLALTVPGVTAPRGNLSTFWSVSDGKFLASAAIEDGCGVSATTGNGGFLVSSGTGGLVAANPSSITRISKAGADNLAWDNHISGLSGRHLFQ